MKAEPKYFCIPSQSYFAIVWIGPNWAQTICRASWMCYLAETSFSFFSSYFFLFFPAGKWWRSSGQCSQVSPSYTLLLCLVCVCVRICRSCSTEYVLHEQQLNIVCVCVCMPVCAWACLYLVSYVSPSAPTPSPFWCQGASIRRNFPCRPTGCNWSHA